MKTKCELHALHYSVTKVFQYWSLLFCKGLGQEQVGEVIASTNVNLININTQTQNIIGDKYFEMSNHLGNVLASVSDRKLPEPDGQGSVDFYLADVTSYSDYFPYGMILRDGGDGPRYGFQGQEKDDEVKGEGNYINYKYRMHDPRVGRFFATDLLEKTYPNNSPYAFSQNIVINAIELEGLEAYFIHGMLGNAGQFNDDPQNTGSNFEMAKTVYQNFTNNTEYDNTFSWNVGRKVDAETGERKGRKLSGVLQTPDDREIAAKMLVDHILTVRQEKIDAGEITSDEEITLIGFSAGGLVALQAAEMLAEQDYKVNIVTVNTTAMRDENSSEHPKGNEGINDMLIIKTKGDKLTGTLKGGEWEYEEGSVPEKFEQIEVESNAKNGLLKHFAKDINIDSVINSGAERLDSVPKENNPPSKP